LRGAFLFLREKWGSFEREGRHASRGDRLRKRMSLFAAGFSIGAERLAGRGGETSFNYESDILLGGKMPKSNFK